MESLLSTTAELLSQAAADPDRVLKWVLIYFGISSLGFIAVWLIGEIRSNSSSRADSLAPFCCLEAESLGRRLPSRPRDWVVG